MKKIMLLACYSLLSSNANALEISGVNIADKVHLGNHDLVLNGAGLRTKFFFKIYVAGLYLMEKTHVAEFALNQTGEKRISLHILRELSDEKMINSFNEVMEANHTPSEMKVIAPEINEMTVIFHTIGKVKEGDEVDLDYLPESGTQVSVNGLRKGIIPGENFNHALFKIWLGNKPAQSDLKQEMLGL